MKHTKKQIEESIVNWSVYMLRNNLATEDEVRKMLNEGLFRRAVDAVKKFGQKTKEIAHAINWAPQKIFNKICKKNKGVEKLIDAMEKMKKSGTSFKDINIYATLGTETYPVLRFAAVNHKSTLVLIVDKTAKTTNPLTLNDLKDFLVNNKIKLTTFIDSIVCAEQKDAEKMIAESKLSDYIEKNKLTKKAALKPDAIKYIKRYITKKNAEDTKEQIEKYFSKKQAEKPAEKKTTTKKPTKGAVSKKAKDASPKKVKPKKETTKEPSSEPMEKSEDASQAKDVEQQPAKTDTNIKKDALLMFDNQLLDVKGEGDNVGFIFSKSKAEIALDKKEADALS